MKAEIEQFVTFYESLENWSEAEAVKRISCPRMTYVGSADAVDLSGVKLPFATLIRERRPELRRAGWHVVEVPDRDHSIWTDPSTIVPIVREFLDATT